MNQKTNKPILDPQIHKFVDELAAKGGTPLYELSPVDARKVLLDVQKTAIELLPIDTEERTIQVESYGTVGIRIIRPQGNKQLLPVIIFMHGGGWVMGDAQTHDRLIREIAHGAQAAVVLVEFTNSPEGQYPLAHEQGYAAAQWISKQGSSLNLDSSRMVIAGDSVGGLMATAIALMAQERGGPQFIFQLLLYPVTDANFETESYKKFAQGPWLTEPAMRWFWDNYVPDKAMRKQPFVSPLQASLEQLKKLPPAFIMTNENDVLRDEGEAYAHKLMQAGVPVVAVRYLGVIHDCLLLNPITKATPIREAIAQVNQVLRDVFKK